MGGASDGDEVRLLARDSQYGYVHDPHLALPDEGEAVSAAYQRALTARAHRQERQRRLDAYAATRRAIFAALDEFIDRVGPAGVASSARAVRRATDSLGRRVERL